MTRQRHNPFRLSIHAGYPDSTRPVAYHLPSHHITVAASRRAEAVAREIQRRLLPDYLSDLAAARDALQQREQAIQAREKGCCRPAGRTTRSAPGCGLRHPDHVDQLRQR
jgi:hypothetical protein